MSVFIGPGVTYVCDRCAVFKGAEAVAFEDEEDALAHAIEFHPNKLANVIVEMNEIRVVTDMLFRVLTAVFDDSARKKE